MVEDSQMGGRCFKKSEMLYDFLLIKVQGKNLNILKAFEKCNK